MNRLSCALAAFPGLDVARTAPALWLRAVMSPPSAPSGYGAVPA